MSPSSLNHQLIFVAGLGSTGSSAVCDLFSGYKHILSPSQEWRIWVDPDGLIDLGRRLSLESSLFWQTTALERFDTLVTRLIKPGFGPYSRLHLPPYIQDIYLKIVKDIQETFEIESYPGLWYGNSNDLFARGNFAIRRLFWKFPLINKRMMFANMVEEKEAFRLIGTIVESALENCLKTHNSDIFTINENYSILFANSIFEMHPHAKIIAVIRDPLDVYADSKRVGWLAMSYEIKQFIKWQNMMYKQVERAQTRWPDNIHLVRFENLCNNYDVELERMKMFIPGVLNNMDTQIFFPEESQKNIGRWKNSDPWLDKYRDCFEYLNDLS